MALRPKQLLDQFKAWPRVLKVLGAVAVVDIVILIFAGILLEDQVDERIDDAEHLKTQLETIQKKIQTTRKDIDRLPQLRKSYDQAVADGVLADQDRLQMVNKAQDLATQRRLNDLHYRLDPQESAPVPNTSLDQVSTPVVFSDGALLDTDVLAFWTDMLGGLQAHYRVIKATIDRTGLAAQDVGNEFKSGHQPALFRAELTFQWVSMRKHVAEAPKK